MPSRVLVVENSPVIRRIVTSVLEEEGCEIMEAEDGLQALDRIEEARPDIIFTDLVMPKIDGSKLSYVIRNTPGLENVFLVVLSGVALEDNAATLKLEADVYIAKGPAKTMRKHVRESLKKYACGNRREQLIHGMEGLFPRKVTEELLVSKKHREVVLAEMSEGVVELDAQGRIVMINRAALSLFGLHEVQMLGRPLSSFLPRPEALQLQQWMGSIEKAENTAPFTYTYDEPLPMGERQLTMSLVPVAENHGYFMVAIFKDVSRRKRMEAQQRRLERELQRVQKLDAMSLMASGIAHDFNNLLTIINGNIEMGRLLTTDAEVAQLLDESIRALDLTSGLIRKFTTFSDTYLLQKSSVDLEGLIRDVLAKELAQTKVTAHVVVADALPPLDLDSELMIQLLANLTRNALKATEGEGIIEVEVDRVDGATEAARIGRSLPEVPLIRLRYTDNGAGIAAEMLDKIFDPYFSTKQKGVQKGVGLGLTIVHSIVKKHGGAVWISSAPQAGCTVWLYFPEALKEEQGPAPLRQQEGTRRVLVLDDDETMRVIIEKMLKHYGCDVVLVREGTEAVELYAAAFAEKQKFDLVLLDLNISEGMGGRAAAEKIFTLDPSAPLVAVSGESYSDVLVNYAEHNFVATLIKPFSLKAVGRLVQRFCSADKKAAA
ncbi:MAG: hypothetical protein CSA34_06155 [Desulfobulbus propionicus]|nr:MAG: hypothetical protein CSA34_06155 [Desulfobulbus propionicus]